jgi:hypothetical protein
MCCRRRRSPPPLHLVRMEHHIIDQITAPKEADKAAFGSRNDKNQRPSVFAKSLRCNQNPDQGESLRSIIPTRAGRIWSDGNPLGRQDTVRTFSGWRPGLGSRAAVADGWR